MSLRDQHRTWTFIVKATPGDCRMAFESTLRTKHWLRGVNWDIGRQPVRTDDGLLVDSVATYMSRAGLAAGLTLLVGGRAAAVEERAIGTSLHFLPVRYAGKRATCRMWMEDPGGYFGFMADAGYIRAYMNQVEHAMRRLDADAELHKA